MSNQMDHAQAVARLFKTVNEDASFQHVCRVLDENSILKGEIEKVRAANEFSDEKIIRLKTDLDSTHAESAEKDELLAAQAREKDALTAELNKKKKELAEISKQLSNLRSELKQQEAKMAELKTAFHGEQQKAKDRDALAEQLDSITNELRDRDNQLQWLGTLSFKLTLLPHEDISAQLLGLFLSALSLAETYFHIDFPKDVLANSSLWKELKAKSLTLANPSPIPVPLKNSPTANKMRTSAFLALLGVELSEHIFQPVYLLDKGHELSRFLSRLASADPEIESYLRSVMLVTITAQMKAEMIRSRVELVVKNVTECVGQLLLPGKQGNFRLELADFCNRAAAQWEHIQQLKEKVEPSSKLIWDEGSNWKPLRMSTTCTDGAADPSSSKGQAHTNGNNGTSRPSKKALSSPYKPSREDGHGDSTNTSISDIREVAAVVWPLFRVNDSDECDRDILLTQGYVLCDAELKTAKEEENQLLISGTRRGVRQSQRRSRTFPGMPSNGGHPHGTVTGEATGEEAMKGFKKGGGGQRSG